MGFRLGTNLGFAVNKYNEPEQWARVVGEELGLRYVQFVADLLNPSWPKSYIDSQIRRIKEATKRHGVTVEGLFTSTQTRLCFFTHPDREAREFWMEWYGKLLEIGAELGAKHAGSHFGVLTFDAYENRREELTEEGIKGWQKLSHRAKELGYECLLVEPMSIPREFCDTIEATRELMGRVNQDCGVPMKVCLDVGHAPHPDQRDPYPWMEALGADSPVIHLQQTVLHKSNHAPFTGEYNQGGLIQREKVMESLRKGGCTDALLAFEIYHREHTDTDGRIIPDLKASVDYWRECVKE